MHDWRNRMKILFITNTTKYFSTRATHGIMYLSAMSKNAGHQVFTSDLDQGDLFNDMEKIGPDVVAYSVMSCNYPPVQTMNTRLKEKFDFVSVFGGPHATYFPDIIDTEGVDAVCRGEGELAFTEFLEQFGNGGDYENTHNFWVKRDGRVFKNPQRPLIEDIDTIPFPDHSLFYDRFWDLRDNPVKVFHTSRGCPLNCAYCHNEAFKKLYKGLGAIVRMRSVDNLIEEIEQVKSRYPLQFVRFFSDYFFLKESWLEEFAEKYPKKIGLPFWCLITPTQVNENMVTLLRKSGCWSIGMGIEAGDEGIRREILNRAVSDKVIHRALKLMTEAGINVLTYNIMGIPGSNFENDMKFLDFNMPYKVTYPMATVMTPFPGTKVYDEAKVRGLLPDEYISYDNSMMRVSPLNIQDRAKVERLQKLLAIIVRFQFLRPLLPTLLKLPLDGFYWLMYKVWMGYVFSRKMFPSRPSLSFLFLTTKRFFFGFSASGVLKEGVMVRDKTSSESDKNPECI